MSKQYSNASATGPQAGPSQSPDPAMGNGAYTQQTYGVPGSDVPPDAYYGGGQVPGYAPPYGAPGQTGYPGGGQPQYQGQCHQPGYFGGPGYAAGANHYPGAGPSAGLNPPAAGWWNGFDQQQLMQAVPAMLRSRGTEQFVLGALVGAAAAWVMTDEEMRGKIVKAGVKLYANIASGFEEMKEQVADIKAEVEAESAAEPMSHRDADA